jgi:hypothetical protein
MEFRIWVETRLDGRILERELVSSVERPASGIGLEEVGLDLEEGKAVLRKVQARIVQTQVNMLSAAHRRCFRCGRNQRVKDLRTGLRISRALAESAMSHLVNQRMGKRQPMRWSAEGAHLLLQVRCAVLDNRLEMLFREWLPFRRQPPPPLLIGAAPNFDTVPIAVVYRLSTARQPSIRKP